MTVFIQGRFPLQQWVAICDWLIENFDSLFCELRWADFPCRRESVDIDRLVSWRSTHVSVLELDRVLLSVSGPDDLVTWFKLRHL